MILTSSVSLCRTKKDSDVLNGNRCKVNKVNTFVIHLLYICLHLLFFTSDKAVIVMKDTTEDATATLKQNKQKEPKKKKKNPKTSDWQLRGDAT